MSLIPELPGYFRFAWMFWMQPISLHRLLVACGIEDPDTPAWRLWVSAGSTADVLRAYLKRLAAILFVMSPLAAALLATVIALSGFEVSWLLVGAGVLSGVVAGAILGVAVAPVVGVAVGTALTGTFVVNFAVAIGAAVGAPEGAFGGSLGRTTSGMGDGALFGTALGVGIGVALGASVGLAQGMSLGVDMAVRGSAVFGSIFGVLYGMAVGVEEGVVEGVVGGVAFGMAAGVANLVMGYRWPLWPIEGVIEATLCLGQENFKASNLHLSPVLWHELSYLPLPFLGRHIEATAASDPALARRALQACAIAPGQRATGKRTLLRLQGRELGTIARKERFRAFVDEATEWLPPEEGADPAVHQLRQVARYIVAADGSSFAHHRLEHLRNAERTLDGAERFLLGRKAREVAGYRDALPAWRRSLAVRKARAEAEAADLLPVPFRAGEPLDPERGRDVFRGREASIGEIEAHLALAEDARSVVLLGPRRTGKSSLLKMLPALLPDAVCVFFDLQGHPVETPAGLFQALEEATRTQARRTRGLDLPRRPDGAPFEAAAGWIELLESRLEGHRLLLCFDEFETLARAFGDSREDRIRLLGLFRSTIQHRRRVRLLLAGEAPFDELDPMWDSHFVSAQVVRLGHLDREVAVDLVRRPIPSFPSEAIPEAVARRLVQRTGAQPYLVQLYAQLLVSRLNEDRRQQATAGDLEAVEDEVLGQTGPYFRDLWNRAPEEAQRVLAELAHERLPSGIIRPARQWLERRCLLDDQGRLTIPVFGRFLREEVL